MLPGFTKEKYREALFSVGEARGRERPLSPVEVGIAFNAAIGAGASRQAVADAFQLDASMVGRFLRLKGLVPEVHHLVDWGRSKDSAIGFSTASELSRMNRAEQATMATAILKNAMTKEETISVIQLRDRSGEPLGSCIQRVLRRRPTIRMLQVVMGAVTSQHLKEKLRSMSQLGRDKALQAVIRQVYPGIQDFSAKLGDNRFTVIGEKSVANTVAKDEAFEASINSALVSALMDKDAPAERD